MLFLSYFKNQVSKLIEEHDGPAHIREFISEHLEEIDNETKEFNYPDEVKQALIAAAESTAKLILRCKHAQSNIPKECSASFAKENVERTKTTGGSATEQEIKKYQAEYAEGASNSKEIFDGQIKQLEMFLNNIPPVQGNLTQHFEKLADIAESTYKTISKATENQNFNTPTHDIENIFKNVSRDLRNAKASYEASLGTRVKRGVGIDVRGGGPSK